VCTGLVVDGGDGGGRRRRGRVRSSEDKHQVVGLEDVRGVGVVLSGEV
jgi:hypothetical protein